MLHEAHPGIGRMKDFARGYVWWPGIDEEMENCVVIAVVCLCLRVETHRCGNVVSAPAQRCILIMWDHCTGKYFS